MSGFKGTITLTGTEDETGQTTCDIELRCELSNHGLGHAWLHLLTAVFGKPIQGNGPEWMAFQMEVMSGFACAARALFDKEKPNVH